MKPVTLDPELLRAFVAVSEHLSFTRAAEQLNRTQATVSLQVKRLEDRLDAVLFLRSTAHVELTAVAHDFLTDARRILALGEEAIARVSGEKVAGYIRIGAMEDYGTKVIPQILVSMAKQFPLVKVEMEIGITSRLLKKLGMAFDAVLAMHPQGASEGSFVCEEKPVWVTGANHAVEDMNPLPIALSNPDCLFRTWALEALEASKRPWRLAYVSPSLAAVEAIVLQGLAVTVIKGSMLQSGMRVIQPGNLLPKLPRAEIRLHQSPNLDSASKQVVSYLESSLRAASPGS